MSAQLSPFPIPSIHTHKVFILSRSQRPYEFLTNCSGLLERCLSLGLLSGSSDYRETRFAADGSSVNAVTLVIFIAMGFLSCWFLLYALMEWTRERQRNVGTRRGVRRETNHGQHWNQRVVNFRSKERL